MGIIIEHYLANVAPQLASQRLGHASASITLDVYSRILSGMQSAPAERQEVPMVSFPGPYVGAAMAYRCLAIVRAWAEPELVVTDVVRVGGLDWDILLTQVRETMGRYTTGDEGRG